MALTVGTNSYIANADADTYFGDTLRAAEWTALGEATQDAALVEATSYLETFDYKGSKTNTAPTQVLKWPRSGVTDTEGEELDDATIPNDILKAQAEIAIRLAADPGLLDSINTQGSSNIKRAKADVAEVEFFAPIAGGRLFPWVDAIIGHLLAGSELSFGATAQGNDDESFFSTGSELYGRSEGFK